MHKLFQILISQGITPDHCAVLFSIKEKITYPFLNNKDAIEWLIKNNYITENNNVYTITEHGQKLINNLNNEFVKANKKTNMQSMSNDYVSQIEIYRSIFPSGKLPSGKPARQNIKCLTDSFRWFFDNYNYTWEEIHKATKMYIDEYAMNDYNYMQTSQYFISKQDKHKVKTSSLADYCDMIKEGVVLNPKHFNDKVV